MAPPSLLVLLVATSITLIAADTDSFVFAGCSQPKYNQGSSYEYNVDSLLSSLANAADFTSYANFSSSTATPYAPVDGLFQCRGDISISDCDSCVRSSLTQLSALCPSAAGAAIQLDGCFLRYGNDSFIGKQDTSLLYKKCGSVACNEPGLLAMRDSALASLQSAVPTAGSHRASRAGDFQALAQCVGDINPKQCKNCVSNAVAQIGESCGFAAAGDLYLGKCYVKYWSGGDHGRSSHSKGNDTGKTLAIIIGVMAGVALIIIFLSFIKRSSSGTPLHFFVYLQGKGGGYVSRGISKSEAEKRGLPGNR